MKKEQFSRLTDPEFLSLCQSDWVTAAWALGNSAHSYHLVDVVP